MKTWIIIGVSAAVLIVLGIFTLRGYGEAKFDAGYEKAKSESLTSVVAITNSSAKKLERIQNENKTLSDTAVDDELRALGIMREQSDR